MEGYLVTSPSAKEANIHARKIAEANGVKTALVCKSLLGKAHTVMAEGGMAASLGHVDDRDNWGTHFRDTMVGGRMLNNPDMVEFAKSSVNLREDIEFRPADGTDLPFPDDSFDVVILDINMPGMDVMELLGELKGDENLADLKICIVSGRPELRAVLFDTSPIPLAGYLDKVSAVADIPVCAGFGIRQAGDVAAVGAHAAGAIVGSALVEVLERGEDPTGFLNSLR